MWLPPLTAVQLVGGLIEPMCKRPTFLSGHPLALSPLAKRWFPLVHSADVCSGEGVRTQRFELFIGGKELANGYLELNDPRDQVGRFEQQAQERASGDDEAMTSDPAFVDALEFGLQPCTGLGIGIDRLVMMVTGATSIKEVLPFPAVRAQQ